VQATVVSEERNDAQLIAAARGGDYDAFESLVRRYRDRIYRLARSMTGNDSEAEEVVQDAFLSLFRGLEQFRGDSSPSSWIYRVAANAALMRLRTRRRKPLLSIEDQPPPVAQNMKQSVWPKSNWARLPDDTLLQGEMRQHLEAAVAKLPEKYRLVLLLRDVEGLSNHEVAEALGLTVGTVKARLHRSRLFVREQLDRYFEGG
jgi:RNA polymerase sigma-70 factor, ECF subfamily